MHMPLAVPRFTQSLCAIGFLASILAATPPANGAETVPAAPAISAKGQHHRVWTTTNTIVLSDGRKRTNTSSFVELGSDMHRWDGRTSQWIEADNFIEI